MHAASLFILYIHKNIYLLTYVSVTACVWYDVMQVIDSVEAENPVGHHAEEDPILRILKPYQLFNYYTQFSSKKKVLNS